MTDLPLKTDFPSGSQDEWEQLVLKGLRGAGLESLLRTTDDGLDRKILSRQGDLPAALASLGRIDLPRLDGRAWHMAAPVRDSDIDHANAQLLENLKGGSSAVRIEGGVDISSRSKLKRLLEGVYTDLVPIQFVPSSSSPQRLNAALGLTPLKTAVIWTGLDPLRASEALQSNLKSTPKTWRLMGISAAAIHEAGGTNVQEIAGLAASLAEAMRRYGAEVVCQHMVIDLAAEQDTHLTIAKFRTARRIILKIADAFGADGSNIPLCAITSLRMMQKEDAWSNLLRIMSAGTGAVIGGADMVTTRPFTDGLGQATPFAHRIARNTQLMMMEESHLGQVSDAALGSYWHENMTQQLAQSAWQTFQTIEAAGGMSAYRNSGALQADLEASRTEREGRNAPILGVTLHPAKDVKAPEVRS